MDGRIQRKTRSEYSQLIYPTFANFKVDTSSWNGYTWTNYGRTPNRHDSERTEAH